LLPSISKTAAKSIILMLFLGSKLVEFLKENGLQTYLGKYRSQESNYQKFKQQNHDLANILRIHFIINLIKLIRNYFVNTVKM